MRFFGDFFCEKCSKCKIFTRKIFFSGNRLKRPKKIILSKIGIFLTPPPILGVLDPQGQNDQCPYTSNRWFPMHP